MPTRDPARSPSRRGAVGLLAAAAVVVMTGCGAPAPVREDGLAVATYEPAGPGGFAALLTGTVEDLDGCLTIRGTDPVTGEATDAEPLVPVFAAGDPTVTRLTVGEDVDLGGGWVPTADGDWDLPSACPPDGPFWMVPAG